MIVLLVKGYIFSQQTSNNWDPHTYAFEYTLLWDLNCCSYRGCPKECKGHNVKMPNTTYYRNSPFDVKRSYKIMNARGRGWSQH